MKRKIEILFLVFAFIFSFISIPIRSAFADDSISVTLNPNTANVANTYTITLKFSSVAIGSGTNFEIGFDEGDNQSSLMNIPTSTGLDSEAIAIQITGNSTPFHPSSAKISSGSNGKRLQFILPTGFPQTTNTTFYIIINSSANIYPKTTGNHTLFIASPLTQFLYYTYTVGTSSSAGIIINSITVANPKLAETSAYSFNFYSSQGLTTSDKIYVQFSSGFTVPPVINGVNVGLVQGASQISSFEGNVSVSGNVVAITIPSTAYTFTGGTLSFGPYTGITNPKTAGNYTFSMWTSKQTTPASYTVTLGTAITNLSWNASQTAAYAISEHNISFRTSSTGALATSDTITVQFPTGFTLPTQIPQGSVLVNNIIAKASISSNALVITCPVSIGNSSQVSIKITTDAKIQNPPSSQTGYKIKVFTSEDPLPFESQAILFTPSIIQNVKVTVSPAVINKSVSISVEFVLGMGGALSSSDSIYIVFPMQFILPSSIANNLVSIIYNNNTYSPSGITITKGTGTVVLALPSNLSILAGSSLKVVFDANANITTPAQLGSYKLKVSTSKETTQVDSLPFDIFAYPKSTIIINPASPDGLNGYYITQPAISFSVSDIAGTTITLYYKINDGNYQTYDLANKPQIKIPEGKTTVYFYAVDSFGNKEPENSKTILVDLTDPIITILTPQENSVIVQPTYTLKGSIKAMDVSGAVLTIDGKAVQINSDGSFEALVSVPKEGVYTTIIKVTSPSGRTATKQFSINYIARVTVFLQVGNDNAYINGEQVKIDAPPF
ncbi:MAG: hypothetical protein ACP5SP_07320, partial [Caldisericum sp.]|uniref:hypothetical protein n=1 Tax=Caldisericum sp. TaxID=2499687 RepID=UPI003D124DE6